MERWFFKKIFDNEKLGGADQNINSLCESNFTRGQRNALACEVQIKSTLCHFFCNEISKNILWNNPKSAQSPHADKKNQF